MTGCPMLFQHIKNETESESDLDWIFVWFGTMSRARPSLKDTTFYTLLQNLQGMTREK